ncbi:MAG: NAD(P)/FAD-dependent oxidoreductase [Clostridia bacterium]|nr:NAD(P)/FAD-dependent oxidoreductase [Clostridia bacterium]
MMKVIVIGGGPAGMMAAITSAENENEVTIIEKMPSLGRKLCITGKGRCNITSSLDMSEFIKNIPGNGMFLYSSFNNYTNQDIINFLDSKGIKVKEERGNRYFPVTDRAQDVLNCFIKRLKELNVKILLNTKVIEILPSEHDTDGNKFIIKTDKQTINADKVIIATGGKSYSSTGSTGDGYELAKKLGHTITDIRPSLVPLECYEKEEVRSLQGLSLKNVEINIIDKAKNKTIYNDFGEMLFTHFGVSGPTILSGSAHLVRYKNIEDLLKNKNIELRIDFKPALTEEKLDNRVLRDFKELNNKQFKNSLDKLLPQKLIPVIIENTSINPEKKVNEITKEERRKIVQELKHFVLHIKDFRPIEEAIITSGGINVKEINPKTMESKIVKGLYFAGEIIDVDAYTGGFNLQIAYSTGFTAGK